jgi:signal transduction histidine kinase
MMLAGIAHEVRNPLGGMTLFVELLREELTGNEVAQGHLKRIATELDYLSRVVNDFLAYARRRPLDLQELDPRLEFEDIRMVCAAELADAHLRLDIRVADSLTKVRWDKDRMRQALLNLIRNAIQASGPESTIQLTLDREGEQLALSVADQGTGIEEKDLDQIFEPFYTSRQKGTGLGLALVASIVSHHGGKMSVTSRPGAGSTFQIHLPVEPRINQEVT